MKKLALFLALCLLVSSLVPAFADNEPVIEEPVVEELAGEQPASEEPVEEEPKGEEPKEEEPEAVEPVVEEPKEEEPETVEPVVEEPKEEEPKEEEPKEEEPKEEEPKEEPKDEEPKEEEPKDEEPAEGEAAEGEGAEGEEPKEEEPKEEEPAEGEATVEETVVPEEEQQVEEELSQAEEELSQSGVDDYVISGGVIKWYTGSDTSITLPKNDKDGNPVTRLAQACFANNKSILNVTIPNGIELDDGCFRNCTSLLSCSNQNATKKIPAETFEGCTSLQSCSWSEQLEEIGHDAFNGCVALTGVPYSTNVKTIGDNAFAYCTSLTYVEFPDGLQTIGQGAFDDCTSLREIILPNSVTSVGNHAFEDCTSATKLKLSTGMTVINNYTFSNCKKVPEIAVPSSITEIGREAFYGCSSATMIRLPKELVLVGSDAFTGRPASGIIRWDDCQKNPPVKIGSNGLGTSGYLLAPIDSAAHEYAKSHSGIKFISTQVKLFVLRCYHIILGRGGAVDSEDNVDEPGLLYWCKGVVDGSQSGASLVKNFMNSQEFANQKNSNTVKVQKLYDGMLDRNGSYTSDEIAYWQKYLDIGMTTDYIVNGFSTSQEFKNLCNKYGMKPGSITLANYRDRNYLLTAFVNRLYTKALERDYDVTGLEYWCKRIYTKNISVAGAATEFFLSKEFKNKVGSDINEFLRRCYRTFFDREPDAKGWDYWWARINAGYTYAQVCQGFATAKEWKNLCAKYGFK